jgi:nucleoside-diphosphate-sugar epimerase
LTAAVYFHRIENMKTLVTGATGFIGSHLVGRLLKDPEREVLALVRDPSRAAKLPSSDRLQLIQGDLFHLAGLPPDIETVYHLAGVTKAPKTETYYTVNRDGTASLLKAMAENGLRARLVYLSSAAAGGPAPLASPRREEDEPDPVSPYGRSKLEAEKVVARFKDRFPAVILRPPAVYGPGDMDFLEYFRLVQKGLVPVLGARQRYLNLIYVRDLVDALLLAAAADTESGQVFNIADPKPLSWEDIGRLTARLLGCRVRVVRVPGWGAFLVAACVQAAGAFSGRLSAVNLSKFREMLPEGWVVDVSKARRVLGFEATTPVEKGLAETLDWYRNEGLL